MAAPPMDLDMSTGLAPKLEYNSLQVGTVISFGVTYFFCTLFIALRYFQAIKLVRQLELDLIILTLSFVAGLAYFVTLVDLMKHGWGRHIDELNMVDMLNFNERLLPNTLIYLITPSVTKLAMLAVLYKINPAIYYRAIVICTSVAILGYTLALTSITGGPCSPLKGAETLPCLQNVALSQAVLNIVSDFAVMILPIPTIFSLQFSLRTKITVCCVLGLGSLVVVCSIARLPYVILLVDEPDATYSQAILGVWSIVEVNLGIICGCLMRLKPFFVQYLPQLGLFTSRTSPTANSGTWKSTKDLRGTDPRHVQHAYQLHSVQKGSTEPISDDGNIHVRREYNIQSEHGRASRLNMDTKGGSTDSILTFDEHVSK